MSALAGLLATSIAAPAFADIDPLSGIDFVRITHPGNAPWAGNGTLDDRAIGRGGVDYEYNIGRFEVTTSQWVEFMNAARDRPAGDSIPFVNVPSNWGASGMPPTVPGGQRWRVPAGNEMRAVGGVTWRMAAVYCNWLTNGKGTAREAFLSGAYDVSTFGYNGNIFTDQLARSPGATYFIPTWDEWLKAVHFDPNRYGEEQPGYWLGPYSQEGIPSGGPPGQGNANTREFAGWQSVPLGAYDRQTPWGLYDAAGATGEWTESVLQFSPELERYRIYDGSFWNSNISGVADLISRRSADFPSIPTYQFGLRIAAVVPSPSGCVLALGLITLATARRTRRHHAQILCGCVGGGRAFGGPALRAGHLCAVSATLILSSTAATLADVDPLSSIDFVRITHPGNSPWAGNGTPNDRAIGRGGVDYEYNIGRFEVTTSQWVEFMNAARDRPVGDSIPFLVTPSNWGAVGTAPTVPGGQRWRVPAGNEMRAVGGVTWRMAAVYCNWLTNGKATNREAFLSGAYDVSTFGYNGNIFTDQLARSPGATYFIPTWDEWLKAVHFDPNRFGEEQPGWWLGPYSQEGIPSGGPPGQGNANWREFAGWQSVLLGAYDRQTPWGLYDAAGATGEWTESVLQFSPELERNRIFDGSFWNSNVSGVLDTLGNRGSEFPSIPFWYHGLRIAAVVPSPSGCVLALGLIALATARRRRIALTPSRS